MDMKEDLEVKIHLEVEAAVAGVAAVVAVAALALEEEVGPLVTAVQLLQTRRHLCSAWERQCSILLRRFWTDMDMDMEMEREVLVGVTVTADPRRGQ